MNQIKGKKDWDEQWICSCLATHTNHDLLRSLKFLIGEGNKEKIMVGMCGEAAADPLLQH